MDYSQLYNRVLDVLKLLATFGEKIWTLLLHQFKIGDLDLSLLEIAFGIGFVASMTLILIKTFTS